MTDRYINPLTDFGFKRIFGTEPNKALLIDFLNVILPAEHKVSELSYRNSENTGNSELDRKAIFDLYCQSESGDSPTERPCQRFIVEIQKAKQTYFKDRSVYYSTFAIQEQAPKDKGWDYRLSPVYTICVLDFMFDDARDDETLLHPLEKRFGQLPENVLGAIRSLAVEDSAALGEAQIDFDSLSELESWLDSRSRNYSSLH